MGFNARRVRSVWEWARPILLALLLFVVVRTFVLEAFRIPTSSMENTLLVGDFLLVNKLAYGAEVPGLGLRLPALADPERGDVVVFNPPHEPDRHYVKRLLGMPGDMLQMREKVLYVNGLPVEEEYARHIDPHGDAMHPSMTWQVEHTPRSLRTRRHPPTRDNWGPIEVPRGRYFVLGDNRDNSEDSRYWGFVPRDALRGRPWLVYYSARPEASDGGDEERSWMREIRWDRIGWRIR